MVYLYLNKQPFYSLVTLRHDTLVSNLELLYFMQLSDTFFTKQVFNRQMPRQLAHSALFNVNKLR